MPSEFDRLFAECGLPGLIGQLGEPLAFYPSGGLTSVHRTVRAIVERSQAADDQGDFAQNERETCWVLVLQDEAHALGGIAAIGQGAAIVLEGDAAEAKWSFAGEIESETDAGWRLKFARRRVTYYGRKSRG